MEAAHRHLAAQLVVGRIEDLEMLQREIDAGDLVAGHRQPPQICIETLHTGEVVLADIQPVQFAARRQVNLESAASGVPVRRRSSIGGFQRQRCTAWQRLMLL